MSVCVVFAQDNADKGGTVKGEVIEVGPEQGPIEGAEIKIISSNGKVLIEKTDADGSFKFTGVPLGRYTINVTKTGFRDRIGGPLVLVEGGEAFRRMKMIKDNFEQNKDVIPPQLLDLSIEPFLQHIAENIVSRYDLDTSTVDALKKSILDAVNSSTTQQKNKIAKATPQHPSMTYLKVLTLLLTEPNTKSAFAKHLTENQLNDYTVFSMSHTQQIRQATAQILTAFLDQLLMFSSKQHDAINKLLYELTDDSPIPVAIPVLGLPFQQTVAMAKNRFTDTRESI